MDKKILIDTIITEISCYDTINLDELKVLLENNFKTYEIKRIIVENDNDSTEYTIPNEIDYFLKAIKLEGKSEKTIANYRIYLNNLFLKLRLPVVEISTNHIREYLCSYQEERGVSNRSLENMRCAFNSFFK